MEVRATELDGVRLVRPRRFGDSRGWFQQHWTRAAFDDLGFPFDPVQDNVSRSLPAGTVRGLHFQRAPHAQAKIVSVLKGSILDVVVDVRPGSPTFGRHVSARLDLDEGWQMVVPKGFAHGFCTLEPDVIVHYKVDDVYAPDCDAGVLWNDPALGIDWPVSAEAAELSDKDRRLPRLAELTSADLEGFRV